MPGRVPDDADPEGPPAAGLTIRAVAAAMGVHYMTAFRWVRLGLLPAEKVGNAWQVRPDDLEAFQAARAGGAQQPAVAWVDRFHDRLLAGDLGGAIAIAKRAVVAGLDPDRFILEVARPAMRAVGEGWAAGTVSVGEEHRAAVIVERVLGWLVPRVARPGRRRGRLVVGCAPGERHGLATSMLSDLLRWERWDVVDLGADVPPADFVGMAAAHDPRAVLVSCTWDGALDGVAQAVAALRDAGMPVLAGGRAMTGDTDDHPLAPARPLLA